MLKVLFTGGGGAGNEALWRLMGNAYELYFGDADIDSINPIIPRDRRVALPWAVDNDFSKKLLLICKNLSVDFLVPGVDEELLSLASVSRKLLPTMLYLPNKEFIEIMLDKFSMIHKLKEFGITVPQTKKFSEGHGGMHFPCIAKPRAGRGSRDVRVVRDPQEASGLIRLYEKRSEYFIFQERIAGEEYTVQMIADKFGNLQAIVPVKVILKRGITLRAITESNMAVINACKRIHKVFPASGCYNIQLILTENGDVYPFEINPRISTTFCIAVAAGIDPFNLFLINKTINTPNVAKPGLRLNRYWSNTFTKGAI